MSCAPLAIPSCTGRKVTCLNTALDNVAAGKSMEEDRTRTMGSTDQSNQQDEMLVTRNTGNSSEDLLNKSGGKNVGRAARMIDSTDRRAHRERYRAWHQLDEEHQDECIDEQETTGKRSTVLAYGREQDEQHVEKRAQKTISGCRPKPMRQKESSLFESTS